MEDVIIKNKTLIELSIEAVINYDHNNIDVLSSMAMAARTREATVLVLSQICNGIAQNTTLQSVALKTSKYMYMYKGDMSLLAYKKSLAAILETNSTIQFLDINTRVPVDVAVVNTPLKALHARPGISSWCAKCTQLEYLQLYDWDEQAVLNVSLATLKTIVLSMDIDRNSVALYERLRFNLTIKNLRLRLRLLCSNRTDSAVAHGRALQQMLSDNATLIALEIHLTSTSCSFINKYIIAGLLNNSNGLRLQRISLSLIHIYA